MNDIELVQATVRGEVHAVTVLFDRFAEQVHDLAFAMLRNRLLAAEVVEATFEEALQRLAGLQEDHRLAVWLLAVARRNAVLRAGPTSGPDRRPTLAGHDAERNRLITVVWEAVADLPLRDRTLVDLVLRHGLAGQDLADALGFGPAEAHQMEVGMRNQIEAGLVGYLIDRATEGRCPALTKALKGWDGRFNTEGSMLISGHVELCPDCNQVRSELPSPFTLYAEAPVPPVPSSVRRPGGTRLVLRVAEGAAAPPQTSPGLEWAP